METKRRMKTLWFFFNKLEESKKQKNIEEFGYYLEAIIPLGRSLTHAIQKEFSNKVWFKEWYPEVQQKMRQDVTFKFFNEKRNIILKEGGSPKRKVVHTLEIHDYINIDYHPPMIILGNPSEEAREKILEETKEVRKIPDTSKIKISQDYYFSDVGDKPAIDLIREWLEKLESIISECYAH